MTAPRRDNRVWLLLFLAGIVLLSTGRWRFASQAGGFTPAAQRSPPGELALPQLGGGEWRLADHRGQVVLINYWATWCGPCREEVPGLAGVAGEFGPKGLAVVGVSLDDGRDVAARVQQFVSRYRVPYPIAFPAPVPRSLGPGDSVIPTTILLDRQGRVVKRYVGAVERGDFARDVTALLAEN
jgi:cytochrome c biogenesis protein CcmG/thiol:disulfide interchange protein DsbE